MMGATGTEKFPSVGRCGPIQDFMYVPPVSGDSLLLFS